METLYRKVAVSEEPTIQLQADKAELLELMTEMKESFDHKAWVTGMELKSFSPFTETEQLFFIN